MIFKSDILSIHYSVDENPLTLFQVGGPQNGLKTTQFFYFQNMQLKMQNH